MSRLNRVVRLKLRFLGAQEAGGTRGVAVKCIDITKNPDCEGSLLGCYRRSCSKARVSNRIRYPGSPRSKRWMPAVWPFKAAPPSESVKHPTWGVRRQRWNSKELTGARTSGGTCGLIRWYARNLTRAWKVADGRQRRLLSSDRILGAAWLSSARAVRCRLKCHNERNPFRRLPSGNAGHSVGTAAARREEGGDDVKSARPLRPGLHTCYNGGHSELDMATMFESRNPLPVRTGVCNPTPRSWIR